MEFGSALLRHPLGFSLSWVLAAAFLSVSLACLIAHFLISRALSHGLIDTPNERSSHTIPTPRGGGVGFVLTFLASALLLPIAVAHATQKPFAFPLWLWPSCAAVALLGFLDDRFSLRASRRLLVQSGATVVSLALLFISLPKGSVFLSETTLSLYGTLFAIFAFFWVVWLTNLYNFLDGIDGYASTEAILVSLAMAGLTFYKNIPTATALLLLFAGAVLGFLIVNWSPAKIFMGDAGSTFLGFFFGVFSVALHLEGLPIEAAIILLGTFIADATYTLLVRIATGKKAHVAHRDHAYQHAVQSGWSHRKTVLVFSAITLFWLTPIAVFAALSESFIPRALAVVVAYLPLLGLQVYFRAGLDRK